MQLAYAIFITDNNVSFQKNLVKYQKVWKYYENDWRDTFW